MPLKKTKYNFSSLKFILGLMITVVIQFNLFGQWTKLNSGTTENLNGIAFIDYDYLVYVVGNKGTLLRSYDQGDTWNSINTGTQNNLNSIFFSGRKFGYITGNDGLTLYTMDGGSTWSKDTIFGLLDVLKIERVSDGNINTIDSLYVLAQKNGNNIFCKRNPGLPHYWNCKVLFGGPSIYEINSFHFVNKDTGYLVGLPDAVFKTIDGGSNWQNLSHILTNTSIRDVYFISDNFGFIVGSSSSGGLKYTIDGANNWNSEPLTLNKSFRSIDFSSGVYGIAVGNGGSILTTQNGGINWVIDTTTTIETLNDVLFYNDDLVFIVGANGTILRNDISTGISNNPILVSDKNNSDVDFFPNPFYNHTFLRIDTDLDKTNLSLRVYNALGHIVDETSNIKNRKSKINGEHWSSGIYIYYLLYNENQIIAKGKIIKY